MAAPGRRAERSIGSIYCAQMTVLPPSPVQRAAADGVAVHRLLRRLHQAGSAPWLHQEVARRMAERLPVIKQAPQQWLDWWGGLGGGAAAVQAVWPAATRAVAEPTPDWQAHSAATAARPWWARWRAGAAPAVLAPDQVAPGSAQMLWSNLNLHLSSDPPATLSQWHRALAVDGFLMFSTFGPDTLRGLQQLYRDAGWPAPQLPFVDMHDTGDQLVAAGFADPVMDQEMLVLSWSTPEALLAELRTLGANLDPARFAGLRTPRWRDRLCQALQARAGSDGRIQLGFELVYGHAYKPAPRPARGELATVSLDALRAKLPKAGAAPVRP